MAAKGQAIPKPLTEGAGQDPPVAPEVALPDRRKLAATDFYGAFQRSLDALQRQLSSANNAFADFVVKEFKAEAAVQIHFNEMGVLQLVPADDTMTPASVSRISLTLAAVAKTPDESVPQNMGRADATALADLSWLPPQLVAQLAQYEIKTASEFLGLVADARFTTQIASLLKVERAEIGRWANRVRLLALPAMTIQHIGLMGELGIGTIADMAQLRNKAIAVLQRKAPEALTIKLLVQWRNAARQALL
ncbi:MAG: DUF4332 domain-containing protein [Limisphaerales bacterium]